MALLVAMLITVPAIAKDDAVGAVQAATGTTYYVSASGDDSGPGTNGQPWRTISRVNASVFRPGDQVLFAAGTTFYGRLDLDSRDAGNPATPVVLGSFGTGRARLDGGTGGAISVRDTGGVTIRDLDVVGSGRTTNVGDGIAFYTDIAGDVVLRGIRVERVETSGFGKWGLSIGSWRGRTGWEDVTVDQVSAHDNGLGGILTYAEVAAVHRGVEIRNSRAFANPGVAGLSGNSGSGIVLGGVAGGAVRASIAYGNGALADATEAGIGIWTYDSRAIVIEGNESFANRTGGPADGGGFGLDQNVSDSVLQYNYSHDNEGAGYLLVHTPATGSQQGNVVRYNISENDGRKNSYAAIQVGGRILQTEVYHNTLYVSPTASGSPATLLLDLRQGSANVGIRNNLLMTTGGLPLVTNAPSSDASASLRLEGNAYSSGGEPFVVWWNGTRVSGLPVFRAVAGQERLDGRDVGLHVAPAVTNAGHGGTIADPSSLTSLAAYRPQAGSPLVDAALDLGTRFGMDTGPRDFHGHALPAAIRRDIGASEAAAPPASFTSTPSASAPTTSAPPGCTTRKCRRNARS